MKYEIIWSVTLYLLVVGGIFIGIEMGSHPASHILSYVFFPGIIVVKVLAETISHQYKKRNSERIKEQG